MLTGKQRKFAIEYVKCLNATESARLAGYEGNDNTLAQVGYENLRKPEIAQFINAVFKDSIMSAEEVLYHVTMIARADISDVTDDNGNIDFKKAKERGKTGLIKTIKSRAITTEESDIVENEVVLHDRLKALDMLGKYHNLINTNRIVVEDWRTEIIALLREGKLTRDELLEEFDSDVAQELLITAGIPTNAGGEV